MKKPDAAFADNWLGALEAGEPPEFGQMFSGLF